MTDSIYTDSGAALNKVNQQAETLASLDNQTEKGYAVLGWMLLEISSMQFWRLRHESWRQYLETVATISKKSVNQLQQYFLTVRDLSQDFTPAQLEEMGITKALKLRIAKDYALVLPASLKKAALDPTVTVKELKQLISRALSMPEDDEGDWLDCKMEFVVTPEERELIEHAIEVARRTQPFTKDSISESAQMLDVMKKFAMEFLSSHSGDGN